MRLALDTATDRLSVALGSTVRDAHSASLAGARRHAGAILPLVDTLLAERGAMRADIASVVLADGPGSFTGLRVGAAVAKALARAGKVARAVGGRRRAAGSRGGDTGTGGGGYAWAGRPSGATV